VASLEPLPPKFHTLTADVGHWTHPTTGEQQNFMVIVDEGSRLDTTLRTAEDPEAIQGLKQLMSKMVQTEKDVSAEELLRQCVKLPGSEDAGTILNSPVEDFRREAELRAAAETALAEWNAQQRIQRALNSRSRPDCVYQPGDLVYFWRTQESNKSKKQPGTNQGRFLGPARVLAMETRQDAEGQRRPAHAIWCVRGRSLIKCSPEQLRPASQREELVEALTDQTSTPWTFTRLVEEVGGNQYQDVSAEVPSAEEWARAQDPRQEIQPARHRITTKRPATDVSQGDPEMDEDQEAGTSQPSSLRRLEPAEPQQGMHTQASKWWEEVKQTAWLAEHTSFWTDEKAAVEVAIDVPQSRRGLETMTRDLQNYFVGALKRKAVEVSERRLSPADRERFQEAKSVEVRNFIAAQAFEALPDELKPSREQAVGMRWTLTWKVRDDGGVKPKARAVLLGYQDPSYEHRSTTSPVMTRQTRQLMLQLSANKRWRLMKGDVSGAFLQGRAYPSELYCIPCDEICQAMGLAPGSITRLKRACYGLVDAPLEWYKTVAEFLSSLGFERLWSDSCAWMWRKDGVTRGMISGHVDDFLFGGRDDDEEWQEILKKIQERFKWGDWDKDQFTQCGVQIETTSQGFTLSQPKYAEGVVPGCVITDSRNVYDKLATAMFSINGAEKKANIELMGLKAAQECTGVLLRWVHSEAQLANALTKAQEHKELELYYRTQHQWRIVEDAEMKSARKRKNE
ncbi:RE1, partial [Symbiodinium sp. CCMP2456]